MINSFTGLHIGSFIPPTNICYALTIPEALCWEQGYLDKDYRDHFLTDFKINKQLGNFKATHYLRRGVCKIHGYMVTDRKKDLCLPSEVKTANGRVPLEINLEKAGKLIHRELAIRFLRARK